MIVRILFYIILFVFSFQHVGTYIVSKLLMIQFLYSNFSVQFMEIEYRIWTNGNFKYLLTLTSIYLGDWINTTQ